MDDCVFCKIANKTLASDILFENDRIMAVRDILPRAPVHLQVFTKRHIPSVNGLTSEDQSLAGEIILVAKQMAEQAGVAERGYKLIMNVGKEGGQVIGHLHMHVMGGKQLPE